MGDNFDIITIGGATQDIFAESERARIIKVETSTAKENFICFEYGDKIELDFLAYDVGGGAANSAANFANLGFKTSTIIKIGNDLPAKAILQKLEEKNIDTTMVIRSSTDKTGFSIILTSYEGDRTVLMQRGANSAIRENDIDFEKIKRAKWIYIASLSGESNHILEKVAYTAENNGVKMAFNPGSRQIKQGAGALQKVLETAEILVLNRDEAAKITKIENNPPDLPSGEDENLKAMIVNLKKCGSDVVVITEGKRGAYAYDGKDFYYHPAAKAKVVSTLGAGDAFASTFTAAMIKTDGDIKKSLKYASANSASVVESIGAQTGFKTFEELDSLFN